MAIPLRPIKAQLKQLDRKQIHRIQEYLEELLTRLDAEEEKQRDREALQRLNQGTDIPVLPPGASGGGGGAGSWIEEKTINGYGPYLYKRWYETGEKGRKVCRSKYLGKKQKECHFDPAEEESEVGGDLPEKTDTIAE